MPSFKQKKDFESSAFPIEIMIREIRDYYKNTLLKIVWQFLGIVFSGIGTSLIAQNGLLSLFVVNCLNIEKDSMSFYVTEILCAFVFFIVIVMIIWGIIFLCFSGKDNKNSDKDRADLAEYFHKIILNNIITGVSFEKKAWKTRERYKSKEISTDDENLKKSIEEAQGYYLRDIKLYICESIYYFKVANEQMNKSFIFESGKREKYQEFIKKVGFGTLRSVYELYDKSYKNLDELNKWAGTTDQNKNDMTEIKTFLNTMSGKVEELEKFVQNTP